MLSELLQNRAALYVSGAMSAPDREGFELILEYHEELREHVIALQKVGTALLVSRRPPAAPPPAELKARLLGGLDAHPRQTEPDAVVVATIDGRVEWVNPAFIALCGYTLEELRGRKPGHLLQGPETAPEPVQRIRESLRERRPCREKLVNYHKDGTRYRVDVFITPILDDEGSPLWFVARERRLQSA